MKVVCAALEVVFGQLLSKLHPFVHRQKPQFRAGGDMLILEFVTDERRGST